MVFCLPGDEPMHLDDGGQFDVPMDAGGVPDQEDHLQQAASPSRSARRYVFSSDFYRLECLSLGYFFRAGLGLALARPAQGPGSLAGALQALFGIKRFEIVGYQSLSAAC